MLNQAPSPLNGALLAGVLTVVYLLAVGRQPPLHLDTLQDLLLAMDCSQGLRCEGHVASVGNLLQGRGWVLLLGAFSESLYLIHGLVLTAHAVAVALAYVLTSRLATPRVAMWTVLFFIGFTARTSGYPILWHPTLAPLAAVACYAGLLAYVARGSWLSLVIAGICLGLATETHLTSAAALPAMVMVVALTGRQHLAPGVFATLAVGTHAALSPGSVLHNMGIVGVELSVAGGTLLLAGSWAGGHWIRRRWPQRVNSLDGRFAIAYPGGFILVVTSIGALVGLSWSYRYVSMASLPLAMAAGTLAVMALERPFGKLRRVGARFALTASLLAFTGTPALEGGLDYVVRSVRSPGIALPTGLDTARSLERRGLSLSQLYTHLAAPNWERVLTASAVVQGLPQAPIQYTQRTSIRLLTGADDDGTTRLPPGWSRLDDVPGAWLSSTLTPWVQRGTFQACIDQRCETIRPRDWNEIAGGGAGFHSQLSAIVLPALDRFIGRHSGGQLRLKFRVTQGEPGQRTLLLGSALGSRGGWRLEHIEGLEHTINGPDDVTIDARSRDPGWLTVIWVPGRHGSQAFPPPVMEFTPGEEALVELLRRPSLMERW